MEASDIESVIWLIRIISTTPPEASSTMMSKSIIETCYTWYLPLIIEINGVIPK